MKKKSQPKPQKATPKRSYTKKEPVNLSNKATDAEMKNILGRE